MTFKDPSRWDGVLAQHFDAPVSLVKSHLRVARLPFAGSTLDPAAALSNPFDLSELRRVEAYREVFDTEPANNPEYFICCLRNLGRDLRVHRELPYSKSLVEFRQFAFDPSPAAPLYPVDKFRRPWRKNRVPVYQAELNAAGYDEFRSLWNHHADPYYFIANYGDVPLGPIGWRDCQQSREELRLFRAAFISKLAEVIEARSVVTLV